ncbi:acyltransferase [Neptunomonas phycophila]|uniref:acyltransferase n=1 Tax=Neptunomonas phycophila TaxID=1572645 RepID=UPI0030F702FF
MKTRLLEFDYMRAVAIILIVLGHSVYNSGKGFPLLLENLLRGGTAVFVFISGFFLHAIFAQRFEYRRFMLTKFKNVYVPFLVVSLVGLVALVSIWVFRDHFPAAKVGMNVFHTIKNFYVLYPHWYIPFIMVVFLLTPIFLAYLKLPIGRQLFLLAMLSVLAMFVHRPHGNANVMHSIAYYVPYYLLGMLYSQYQPWFLRHQKGILVVSIMSVIFALIGQTYIWVWVGNSHKDFFEFRGVDLQFIQKLGLCFILLAICQYWARAKTELHQLKEIGNISFAIFFIHPLFTLLINVVSPLIGLKKISGGAFISMGMTAVMFLIMFYGSIYATRMIRAAWPGKSRWLIGA